MKYLLTTDGSDSSEQAALFLAGLPLSARDHVDILHVVTEPAGFGESYDLYDELLRVRRTLGEKILEETLVAFKSRPCGTAVYLKQGYPYQNIIDTGTEFGSELIIMGSRGHSALETFLLGSVARQVAIHSPIPVCVVKPPTSSKNKDVHRILFATDGSECSTAAAGTLLDVPLPASAELILLHVVDSALTDIPERFSVEIDDRIKETVAKARQSEFARSEDLLRIESQRFSGRFDTINTMVRPGEPAAVITENARSMKVDLVVVGCRGQRGIAGVLGSVTRRILSHAPCSVLVGKLSEPMRGN